ncbi:MAG TPA: single-stranded DNA-binding protein [Euzebya sp.]|nr:single-stranded DNA-binding protein [Euzebya sp.]
MATENTITVIGNLTKDPDLRYTQSGVAVASLSVAVNRRMRNKDTNEWEDKLDGYFDINVWRDHAENVAESLHKGDRVLVIGRLIKRSYEDREGQTKWVTEIEADEICPSLRWARATVSRVSRGGGGAPRPAGAAAGAPMPSEPPTPDDVPF